MRLTQLLEQLEHLFENRKIELIVKKQGQKILKAHRRDRSDQRTTDLVFGATPIVYDRHPEMIHDTSAMILNFFQSKIHKKYVQWLANRYINKEFQLEDWKIIRDDLKQFDRIKNKLRIKDINQYESLVALDNAIDSLKDKDVRSSKQKQKEERAALFKNKEAILFYKDSDIKIEVPKTEEAACILGKGTRWCTSARDHNMFDSYAKDGDLYIITTKSGDKYQFHMESKSFMDASDREIPMKDLLEEYPSILKAIPDLADSLSMFDKAAVLDMSNDEVEKMIKEWIKSDTNFEMFDDNTVVIETYNDLDRFFRDYDFAELSNMISYIEDPADLEHEFDLKVKDIPKYINQEIIDMIHAKITALPQFEMFDISTNDEVFNTLNKSKKLSAGILEAIVEDMTQESVAAMTKYLEEGMKGDAHEHGVMGFLFDTEYSHTHGFLLETDKHRNFYESSYGMSLEMYELVSQLTEVGYEDMDDNSFAYEVDHFFGEEFMHNDDLKNAEDFYYKQNMDSLKTRIEVVLKNWKGVS